LYQVQLLDHGSAQKSARGRRPHRRRRHDGHLHLLGPTQWPLVWPSRESGSCQSCQQCSVLSPTRVGSIMWPLAAADPCHMSVRFTEIFYWHKTTEFS
jgi:hypothetical protein